MFFFTQKILSYKAWKEGLSDGEKKIAAATSAKKISAAASAKRRPLSREVTKEDDIHEEGWEAAESGDDLDGAGDECEDLQDDVELTSGQEESEVS